MNYDNAMDLYKERYQSNKNSAKKEFCREVTFQVTEACNLKCTYCVEGDTLITMIDGSKKPIKDIKIGDVVLGFDEYSEKHKQKKLRAAVVEKVFCHQKRDDEQVYDLRTEYGDLIITGNHKLPYRGNLYLKASSVSTATNLRACPINITKIADSPNYDLGYFIGVMVGDGSYNAYHYDDRGNGLMYKVRLALKDNEPLQKCAAFMEEHGINFYWKDFLISSKENLVKPAIFSSRKDTYETICNLVADNININNDAEYLRGFLAGIYDTEGHIDQQSNVIRITNSSLQILMEIKRGLDLFEIPFVIEEGHESPNTIVHNIRIKKPLNFLNIAQPKIQRKQFQYLNKSYICNNAVYSNTPIDFEGNLYNIQTSTRTYIANNVLVHNCYQIHKTPKVMSWEVAKAGVDLLFNMWIENKPDTFINQNTELIILDFIGGEPMLQVELIDKICTYFMDQALEINPLWAETFMISMASNGTIYFTPEVQEFIRKWNYRLSYSVSMDGPKEMHDACRVFPDGRGSYDLAKAAQDDYNKTHYHSAGTKATISWENMPFLDTTIKYYIDQGYTKINANTIYEENWTPEQGALFYIKLKQIADTLLERNGDIEISLFNDIFFQPRFDMEQTWCFGAGTKILTDQGYKDIETIQVGDMVMTANGYQPVEATKSHWADNVVKAHVSGVFDFICTDDHPFFCKPFDYLGNKGKKHFKEYQVLPLKEVGHKDLLPLFSYDPDFGKDYDPKLAYLVGRYIGDGWRNHNVHSICSAFDEMDELEYRLEDADIHYSKAMNKTVAQYTIPKLVTNKNKELTRILNKCGQGADGKRIPEECFQWNREALEALLQGYLDADGSLKPDKKYVCNTVSRELAEDLMLLIRSLGYNPTCYFNKRAGKSTILGREVTIKDRYEIYFFADPSRSRYVQHDEDNVCWTYGIKTTPTEPCTVYNLTIANNHSFVANGILVHNCGGYDSMLAFDTEGNAFPCIRYMESSLGGQMPPVIIGDVWNGLWKTPEQQKCHECLANITWTSQNDEECLNCPIAQGCADCAAESYQHMKAFNKRHKLGSCWVHRARSLANVYYWNKLWRQQGSDQRFKRYLPDDIALQIISKEELEYLNSLEKE